MNNNVRSVSLFVAMIGAALNTPVASAEKMGTVSVDLPAETAQFRPGPGVDTARQNCITCHSVDYVYMQPPLSAEKWRAVVMKMKKVMGGDIPDNDIDTIVQYLVSQNGKK
jgi:sulfite dehydrogenase (cytochrome) subunit B